MSERKGRLSGRRLALGITGSIAAYKAVELLRLLQAEGADVRVLMTPAATSFIGPLTLETLSGHPVDSDVLALQPDGRIGHISAAHDVEAIVVAPATARWLAAMAIGLASDSIVAACLATEVPVVVAPAMDGGMYSHPATRANVARLREYGYRIVEPEEGELASGMIGRGRLASLPAIVDAAVGALSGKTAVRQPAPAPKRSSSPGPGMDLAGRHVVVTAGGTMEPIDPVRFVGNRSSGKMGVAIAEAAVARGAAVTLILANASVEPPAGVQIARVETAAEMQAALRALTPPQGPMFDALVMAAAVADFRPAAVADRKLGRGAGLKLDLEPTPDLLAEAAERVRTGHRASGGPHPVLVGFAAETGSLERAQEKLRAKGVDLLVANDVTEPGSGFGTDTNRVTIYTPDAAPEAWPLLSKREVAELLLDRILVRLGKREPAPDRNGDGRDGHAGAQTASPTEGAKR